ncbi:MAG: hypothetical protein ACYTFA_08590 [Planctomycetota bacterium]|jgi:hypothetical protein
MKLLVKVLVAAVLALGVLYYLGGLQGFDSSQQGRDHRAAITPGMSWTKVFDITGDPREYNPLKKDRRGAHGMMELVAPSAKNKFRRERVSQRLKENSLPLGFEATFHYSNKVAFTVRFDGLGNVVSVRDAATMADLLQYDD